MARDARRSIEEDFLQAAESRMRGESAGLVSLLDYARRMYPEFATPWHLREIAAALEAVERGDLKRLMIFAPPRHGKSMLTSQAFPAWYLGRRPGGSVIFTSYSADLASDFGRRVRNLVKSPEHAELFPASRISADSSSVSRFDLTAGGSYYAVGRGGALTGRGASVLLADDPIKDHEEADSETVRRSLHEWFGSVAYTRLAPDGAVVLINTRWNEDDLSGHLLKNHADEGWRVISLPAIAEGDETHRREGEALWPERFPLPTLEAIRRITRRWPALYQQRPSAIEGEVFKRSWWRTYSAAPSFSRVIQVWDTAFKAKGTSDYSVCSTWGDSGTEVYLLHVWRERVEFPALLSAAQGLAAQWNPHAVLVEDRASGQSLIQVLREQTGLPVIARQVETDKVSRATAVTPMIEAGRVLIPTADEGWKAEFLEEVSAFPNAAHDDQVDTLTMALAYFHETRGAGPMTLAPRSIGPRRVG